MQIINLNINKKTEIPLLHVKQGDTGRTFQAVLFDGDESYSVPAGAVFSVWYSGTGGAGNYTTLDGRSAFAVDGNTVTVELSPKMLACKGGGLMCIVMNSSDGTQLGLWNIPYFVEGVPGSEGADAQSYFDAFAEVVAHALEASKQAQDAVDNLKTDTTLTVSGKPADAYAAGEALAGKAPAGFGYGETLGVYDTADNTFTARMDSLLTRMGNNTTCQIQIKDATFDYNTYVAKVWKLTSNYAVVEAVSYAGHKAIRRKHYDPSLGYGVWEPWEWENPPMRQNVEYRTTERCWGKAVYTKVVNFGHLPNAAAKSVEIGIHASEVVRSAEDILTDNGYSVASPYFLEDGTFVLKHLFYSTFLQIITTRDCSGYSAKFQIWYTKD